MAGLTTIYGSAAADSLAITGTNPFTATLNGTAIGPIAAQGGVAFDGAGGSDTLIGPDGDSTWTITGANAGTLGGAIPLSFANVENLTGGAGNDTFAFAPAGNVAGMIDGGGGTNALDYSAFTTPIHANLGINVTASASWLYAPDVTVLEEGDADQGSASFTYYAGTGTFDITANAQQMSSSLQPFTLNGPNGQILNLLQVPGATSNLAFNGLGRPFTFTYSATAVVLPAAYEAAFIGSQLTLTLGPATGKVTRGTQTASATGTATGTGGISNIANVTGGAGDDSIVGSFGDNVLRGGDGANTFLGGPGADTLIGGAGNDLFLRGTGDGSDTIDGGAGNDTRN